jgi:hypothetical protein
MRREGRPGKTPRRARALRGLNALLCIAFLVLPARLSLANEDAHSEPLELIELSVMQITGDIDLDTVLSPIEVTVTRRPAPVTDLPQEPAVAAISSFEDQYLFAGDEPVYGDGVGSLIDPEPLGRRSFNAEAIYYHLDDDLIGDETEKGVRASWQRETESWGVLNVDLQFIDYENNFLQVGSKGDDVVMTFRQSAVPIANDVLMNSTFGHQRTRLSSLLHSSYRYRLPISAMLGATAEFQRDASTLRFSTGKTGFYRGVALPRFDETGGRLTSVAFEHTLDERFDIGGEVSTLDGDDLVDDNTSILLAGRFRGHQFTEEHAARLLLDDDANIGLWTDSYQELASGPFLRYGAFYFDPELSRTDQPIANDQTGVYLRGDYMRFRLSASGGYDVVRTGLGSSDAVESLAHTAYFNSNFRPNREVSLGMNGNLILRDIDATDTDEDQTIWRLNTFASWLTSLGTTRLDVFREELDSNLANSGREQTGVWARFDWNMPQAIRFTNELRVEWSDDYRGDSRRDEVAMRFRYDVLDNLSFGMQASYYQLDGDALNAEDGIGMNVDARWNFLPNWYLSLSVNNDTVSYDDDTAGLVARDESTYKSAWLTIGYGRTSGRPFQTFGRLNGGVGTGSIVGQVFYDENQDGIRQPSEEAAVGAIVMLDGQYETRTDSRGYYTFSPVPTGTHEVIVLTEEVPLPWGLEDERPREVDIGFRRDSNLSFPLQRLN